MTNHPGADFQPLQVILRITMTTEKENYTYLILSPAAK